MPQTLVKWQSITLWPSFPKDTVSIPAPWLRTMGPAHTQKGSDKARVWGGKSSDPPLLCPRWRASRSRSLLPRCRQPTGRASSALVYPVSSAPELGENPQGQPGDTLPKALTHDFRAPEGLAGLPPTKDTTLPPPAPPHLVPMPRASLPLTAWTLSSWCLQAARNWKGREFLGFSPLVPEEAGSCGVCNPSTSQRRCSDPRPSTRPGGGPVHTFCWEPAWDTHMVAPGGGDLLPSHLEVLYFTQPDLPSHSFKYTNKYVNNKDKPHA